MENPCTWRHKFKPARFAIETSDPSKRTKYMYNAHPVRGAAKKSRKALVDRSSPPTTIDTHG
jgi:hypothetical protein